MIPKFDIYHSHLHSSFIKFDQYTDFLKNDFFNGYVLSDFGGSRCFLMFMDGEPHAILSTTHNPFVLKSVLPGTYGKMIQKDCFISSYKCSSVLISFFSRSHTAKLIYNHLTTQSISPEKLIEKCQAGLFTGLIEVLTEGIKKKCVYFDQGEIIGTMNVASADDCFKKEFSKAQVYDAMGKFPLNLYEFAKQAETVDAVNGHREGLVQCFEEILQWLEKNAVGQDFSSIWRINARKLSGKYSFLDPFVAEFSYENQKIDLWEEVEGKQAGKAMDELCETIAKTLKIPMDGIKDIKSKYNKILVDYEIRG